MLGADGSWREKSDPMAFATEVPPLNASVVTDSQYTWGDDAWLADRAEGNWHARPISAYEVHVGSWKQGLSYRQLADELVEYASDAGFTHLEFMPVAEHPFGGSWGYQVTSYFAPSSRFGVPDDFRYLVDKAHQAGLGILIDWVPAHFPKDEWALARFDGTPLYEHGDPRRGEQPDWGTLVFDFGRSEVRNFLVANALYWCKEFHVDGIRVDAVASMLYLDYSRDEGEWTPNVHGGRENLEAVAFLQEMNATVYREVPGVMTIAEESTAWPGVTRPTYLGGLGFGFKWNMGWMHDSLGYIEKQPVHRVLPPQPADLLAGLRLQRELRAADQPRRGGLRQGLAAAEDARGPVAAAGQHCGRTWPTCGPTPASSCCSWARSSPRTVSGPSPGSLDWWHLDDPAHRGVLSLVSDLNARYKETEALWSLDIDPAGFQWIDANDAAGNVLSFLRYGSGGSGPGVRGQLRRDAALGLPDRAAPWRALARGAQHRRRGLRRLRGGQPGRGGRGRRTVARAAVLGHAQRTAAGHRLVRARGLSPGQVGSPSSLRGRRAPAAPRPRGDDGPPGRAGADTPAGTGPS